MLSQILLAVAFLQNVQDGFPTNSLVPKPASDAVVGQVNGTAIKASQIEPYLWDWHARAVFEQLAYYKLVADDAAKSGIKVTDAEVDAKIGSRTEQVKTQLQGMSKAQVFLLSKMEVLIDKLALRDFSPLNFYKVSTIVIRPESEQASALAAAIQKADAAYQRLQKGEKWEAVIKSVVVDQQLARNNGLIGWRHFSAFPATVGAEIKTLKPGQVTKPAQTQFGIQIFRLEAKGDTLAGQELEDLKGQFMQATRQGIFTKLRDAARIEFLLK